MPQEDIAGQWKSFDPQKRERLLGKMSPEQKKRLRGILEAKPAAAAAPTQKTPGYFKRLGQSLGVPTSKEELEAAQPSWAEKIGGPAVTAGKAVYNYGKTAIEGIKEGGKEVFEAGENIGKGQPVAENLGKAEHGVMHATLQATPIVGPAIETAGEDIAAKNYRGAAGGLTGVIGQVAAPEAVRRGLKTAGELRASIAPRPVPIAGEEIPVLKGEADPESLGGRAQIAMKKGGGPGAHKFREFAADQQAKVKEVIRKVAQRTSGAVGPMEEEPGAAMNSAATATFAKASPMYEALDESLVEVPDGLSDVSKVTERAIAQAKKWGVELPDQEWNRTSPTTPITTYMKVRSQLSKMLRGTSDAAQRYAIRNDLSLMNANMEEALKGTPLLDSWHEADRLWSKGYAIRDVAEALKKTTEGTPAAEQAPSLSKVPTKTTGDSLVSRLNDLKDEGVLAKAFSPEEIQNLRQAADILDRAKGAPGLEFGYGYGLHSTFMRNLVKLPAYPLVKAMTTPAGVSAIKAGDVAAITALVEASAPAKNRKDALDKLGRNPDEQ